jgi:hypothetical protein
MLPFAFEVHQRRLKRPDERLLAVGLEACRSSVPFIQKSAETPKNLASRSTVKPETRLAPVLVGRIVTSILVGGGSQIVHPVVNKARDPTGGCVRGVDVAKPQQ